MAILSKGEILKQNKLPTEEVAVPEWGGSVMVRGLTARQVDAWRMAFLGDGGKVDPGRMGNMRADLVSRSVVDKDGQLLFGPTDVAALGDLSSSAIDRVFAGAQRLSGISEEEQAAMVENFTPDLNGDSSSG